MSIKVKVHNPCKVSKSKRLAVSSVMDNWVSSHGMFGRISSPFSECFKTWLETIRRSSGPYTLQGRGFYVSNLVELRSVLHNFQLCSIWGLIRPLRIKILRKGFVKGYMRKLALCKLAYEIHQAKLSCSIVISQLPPNMCHLQVRCCTDPFGATYSNV
jgi:hypothetical protein